jgi:hypothetical protein
LLVVSASVAVASEDEGCHGAEALVLIAVGEQALTEVEGPALTGVEGPASIPVEELGGIGVEERVATPVGARV